MMKSLSSTLKLLARTATVAAVTMLYTPGVQAAPGAGAGEKHPHIRTAIHELREAAREMKEAAHDFGGHREDALKATDSAIEQLRICMESDRKAGGGKGTHAEAPGGAATHKAGKAGGEIAGDAKGEHHPHIHAALRELHEAARELKEAAHDFGGHREDALKATDRAMEQLRKALEFDKK